jgi:outer membrane protein assembly factor BamB
MFRKSLLLAGIFAASLLTQSCSLFERDVYVVADVPEIQNQFEPRILWKTSVGDGVDRFYSFLVPAVSDEKVFVASRDGDVECLERATGKTLWSIDLSDEEENDDRRSARISGGVSLGLDSLYVTSENGYVYAIDRSDGSLKWKNNIGYELMSRPLALADRVVVLTTDGQLVALSDYDGHKLWSTPKEEQSLTLRGTSSPIEIERGKLIMYGTSQGKISIVDSETGMLVHSFIVSLPKGSSAIETIGDVDAMPLFVDGQLYAVGYHGSLLNIIAGGGWKKEISSSKDIGYDYSDIFVTDDEGHIHSVSRSSGEERWLNRDLSYRGVTGPVSYRSYVLVGDMDGYLYWLDNATGTIVSMDDYDGSGLNVAPVVYDDVAYLQTRSGKVYAITLKEDGE